jgi:hypothetical protein
MVSRCVFIVANIEKPVGPELNFGSCTTVVRKIPVTGVQHAVKRPAARLRLSSPKLCFFRVTPLAVTPLILLP